MNITDPPEIPVDVHTGEPVRADDMNRILEWMRAAQSALAALASETASVSFVLLNVLLTEENELRTSTNVCFTV